MKIQTNVPLPAFTEEDRKDVQKYLNEFDRIAKRAAGGGEPDPAEYNTLLISAAPHKSLAGRRLRKLKDEVPMYLHLESTGDHIACRELLRDKLFSVQKKEFLRDTNASDAYEKLKFGAGGDIEVYHTDYNDVLQLLGLEVDARLG